jgi:hypothetical protein
MNDRVEMGYRFRSILNIRFFHTWLRTKSNEAISTLREKEREATFLRVERLSRFHLLCARLKLIDRTRVFLFRDKSDGEKSTRRKEADEDKESLSIRALAIFTFPENVSRTHTR